MPDRICLICAECVVGATCYATQAVNEKVGPVSNVMTARTQLSGAIDVQNPERCHPMSTVSDGILCVMSWGSDWCLQQKRQQHMSTSS